jgi:hypothetical protein
MFDHKRFKREVSDLLDVFDSGALDRAWDVTCGLVEVVAKVDKRDDETLEQSRQSAWLDLYRAFDDQPATYTYWGMYEEMCYAVRERGDELEKRIVEVGESCLTKKPKRRAKAVKPKGPTLRETAHAHLRIVES